ncbi:porin family protein [Salinibacter ruber]|uniref:porin family protein n=1 Tax=Salinibacter ruber TaxID=146919 RepID=UPI002169183C|nr:porin family protein [Salinibacter ruber]MCS4201457.1 opacity protein-like surface antigen [Salinibacter ruber]
MQKLATVLTLLLLSVGFSHAQDVEVGLRGGPNYATFKGDTGAIEQPESTSAEYSRVFGARFSGFLRFSMSESFSVRTEVGYSQKGSALDVSRDGRTRDGQFVRVDLDLGFRYDYLDVPILAEYSFKTGSRFRPQVFAGPSIGFALNSNLDSDVTARVFNRFGQSQEIDPGNFDEPESPDIETTDIGAVIGGGVSYVLGSGDSLFLDVRYNPSFTAFNSDDTSDTGQSVGLENEAITVGVGYSFSL